MKGEKILDVLPPFSTLLSAELAVTVPFPNHQSCLSFVLSLFPASDVLSQNLVISLVNQTPIIQQPEGYW